MAARNLTPPFPFRRTALALALRQVLQQRRWQGLVAAGMVGLAPVSLGDPFPADFQLSSLDGTNGFRLSGVAAADFSGFSVSAAGDVNGDGMDDILIGAYRADPNGDDLGASYVVFGGSGVGATGTFELSMLDGTNGFKLSGVAADDHSGISVSGAGDVNGDGTDDLLIGAHFADPNGDFSGASYVVFGGPRGWGHRHLNLSSLDGTNGFKLSGVAAGDLSGDSVSAAGDVNGDGTDDLLIGAPFADPNGRASGASYVVFGRSGVGSTGNLDLSDARWHQRLQALRCGDQ